MVLQGTVRTREYERDGMRQRIAEVRADAEGKLDCAERRSEGKSPEGGEPAEA